MAKLLAHKGMFSNHYFTLFGRGFFDSTVFGSDEFASPLSMSFAKDKKYLCHKDSENSYNACSPRPFLY